MHGQTTGHNLCTGWLLLDGRGTACLATPRAAQSGRLLQEPLGEQTTQNRSQKRAPQLEAPNPPWVSRPEAPLQLPRREPQTASPALVPQGRRRQRQVSPLHPPKSKVGVPGGSEYIFWVLHKVQEFKGAQSSRQS